MEYEKIAAKVSTASSLCETCVHGLVARSEGDAQRFTICDWPYVAIVVPIQVASCGRYQHRNVPELDQMEEIALDLTKESAVIGRIGFRSGEEDEN